MSASGAQQRSAPGWGLPLAVLIAGVFMSILDITIVNVAIPTVVPNLVPSTTGTATDNGSPARQTDGLIDVGGDPRPRDT
jgi:hypothetical protein